MNTNIKHVSDTALWVAHYRATESQRADALFNDRLADVLVGERGRQIAAQMHSTSRYTQWSVVIRTAIIDQLVFDLVKEGIDTVINLGAGLDTRPYRLDLPRTLKWIEIDYPHIIEHKEKLLAAEKPVVSLHRIGIDLADREKRKELFANLGKQAQKALVMTEGVIIYLTEEQVSTLAEDIHAEKSFAYWIAEYISPQIYRYFNSKKRQRQMVNAPFQFFPLDWWRFFKDRNWVAKDVKYTAIESEKLGRKQPIPIWASVLFGVIGRFMNKEKLRKKYQERMGYTIFVRA